ncbi:NAD(P)-dependent malic enzyme [Erysipelothrix rhusiopathiae]|uniref:NAD(P)-dependent malic enzyme n=1 Tax=Erysipelothrix rhusiopathiae TaxID=1648 RepID=UPI000F42F7AF|nr:NADP-dependent malic enzyme [Erysipelothrix rhusiopathiae]AYV34750.1 NADP-dependent malic enzyme [Erysipelothrix rhusiopathiae]
MNHLKEASLELHQKLQGKIEVNNKQSVTTQEDLSLLYSPGVAEPCLEIKKNKDKVYDYTWKGNTVAVISNGSAVLGLGDIGAEAGLPVMEGKAMLFKAFSGLNAIPLVLDAQTPEAIISFCEMVAPSFGAINLEDIKAPECVFIEEALQKSLSIPVFHDDQHGTAIVVLAGLMNACRLVGKTLSESKVVISGTGAAGSAIIKMLYAYGVRDIYAMNSQGIISTTQSYEDDAVVADLCQYLSDDMGSKTLHDLLVDADIFIGVSIANLLTAQDIVVMNEDAIVFALANPNPEIPYDEAIKGGARVVGTGRSDYPNQINNVLAFPGIFKGAMSVRATEINASMKLAAAQAIASLIPTEELKETYIIPSVLDPRVVDAVSQAVAEKAIETGIAKED